MEKRFLFISFFLSLAALFVDGTNDSTQLIDWVSNPMRNVMNINSPQ